MDTITLAITIPMTGTPEDYDAALTMMIAQHTAAGNMAGAQALGMMLSALRASGRHWFPGDMTVSDPAPDAARGASLNEARFFTLNR